MGYRYNTRRVLHGIWSIDTILEGCYIEYRYNTRRVLHGI